MSRVDEIRTAHLVKELVEDILYGCYGGVMSEVDVMRQDKSPGRFEAGVAALERAAALGLVKELQPEEYPDGTLIRRWGKP